MASLSDRVGTQTSFVEQSPLPTTFVRSHSRFVLSWPADGALVIKYHRVVRVVAAILCVLGLPVLLVGLLALIGQLLEPKAAGFVGAGLLLLWGGSVGLMGVWLFGPRYRFDVSDGLLTIRHFGRTRRLPLARIIAVQMIEAGWFGNRVSDADTSAVKFRSFQLNLVLDDPDEPRLFVAYNSDVTDMARKTKLLADFLGLPLLAAPQVHELLKVYAARDVQEAHGDVGVRSFRGVDVRRPVPDRLLPEPYRSWIDGTQALPDRVRLLPRSIAVLYDVVMFLSLGVPCLALMVLIILMFGPVLGRDDWGAMLFVGIVLVLLALIPIYLLRRLCHTIGAWYQLRRGRLRQGILVGAAGVLVRMEPNHCHAIPLDRFVNARVDEGLLRATQWSQHIERPDFVIETLDGPIAFFLDWSTAPPDQLNQWVAHLRAEPPLGPA